MTPKTEAAPATGSGSPRQAGPPARQRLLQAATRLFYAEGIQAVGVDRLVTEAAVTKATFYRHFPTKDDLVRAYIQERDQAVRATADALAGEITSATDVVTALVTEIGHQMCSAGFRGCAFINATVEYPDPDHPVRHAVAEHRRWFRTLLTQLLQDTGHPHPETAAETLVLLRDGAMMGGYLDDPTRVPAALQHAVNTVLSERG
jgi:AcrR family transcriptional regulator